MTPSFFDAVRIVIRIIEGLTDGGLSDIQPSTSSSKESPGLADRFFRDPLKLFFR
jgi:hypothetical protein